MDEGDGCKLLVTIAIRRRPGEWGAGILAWFDMFRRKGGYLIGEVLRVVRGGVYVWFLSESSEKRQ
jgi:hypothetical protein